MSTIRILTFALAAAVSAPALHAAEPAPGEFSSFRKNLARHHLGTALLKYNAETTGYEPTEASAAWLDDDVATGWPAAPGKSSYLLALAEPALATNFALSARNTAGKVSLYAADEALPPGDKGWTAIAKDVPVEKINNGKLSAPFNRLAKFFLIETDSQTPGPLYSLYLYGNKPAVEYDLWKRDTASDPSSALGGFVNESTGINLSGLYAGSRVVGAGSSDGAASYQTAIDDDPQSSLSIPASETPRSLVLRYGATRTIQRVSAQADHGAKGTLEFHVESGAASDADIASGASAAKVAELRFDGGSDRATAEFPPVSGNALLLRWVPEASGEPLVLRELNSFGDITPANYSLTNPDAIGQGGELLTDTGKGSGKESLPPIAEGPGDGTAKSPYLPGPLGPPPQFDQPTPTPTPTPPRDNPVSAEDN